MQFTKKDLDELKEIHWDEFGEKLSDSEAQEMGERLVRLLRILRKPLPHEMKRGGMQ